MEMWTHTISVTNYMDNIILNNNIILYNVTLYNTGWMFGIKYYKINWVRKCIIIRCK